MRLLLAALLSLLAPAAAGAATVTHTLEGELYTGGGCAKYQMCDQRYTLARLVDAAGERNDVTVTLVSDGVLFRDAASPPAAGAGCAPRDGGVWCPATDAVEVILGAGDDRASSDLAHARLEGGPGNDDLAAPAAYPRVEGGGGDDVLRGGDGAGGALDGGAGADTLLGGAGAKLLIGGPGDDVVAGGAGDDALVDEPYDGTPAADADRYDGGPGTDRVGYEGADSPVDVDLRRGTGNGQTGEGDIIAGVEDVTGGGAADVLAGDDGPNRLDGGVGAGDRVDGRGGDDRLAGRVVVCGDGLDVVERARRVSRECERAPLGTATATIGAGVLTVRDLCDRYRRCRMRLVLRDAAGALLGTARARPRPWRSGTMRVALPAGPDVLVARYAGRELRIGQRTRT